MAKYRFGKHPPKVDYRSLRFMAYVKPTLAAPPPAFDVLSTVYKKLISRIPQRCFRWMATIRSATAQSLPWGTLTPYSMAFSDPSDVFSCVLPKDFVPREDVIISNVVISNDCTYMGLFENTENAHIRIHTEPPRRERHRDRTIEKREESFL